MSDEKDKIMGVEGMAKYLNLSKSTVYKLAQDGALPGQKVGKHWRFRQERVNSWLDEERPPSKHCAPKPAKSEGDNGPQLDQPADVSPFGTVFSPAQIARLQERWIETPEQLLSIATTPRGLDGICQLLEIEQNEFAEDLQKLQRAQGVSTSSAEASTAPGGQTGLRIEGIPGKAMDKDSDEK